MLVNVYPWSFVLALGGLLCWSLVNQHKSGVLFRSLFFVGIGLWLGAVILAPVEASLKSIIILRDLIVLGVAGLTMSWAKNNLFTGIALLLISGLFLQYSYLPILRTTLQSREITHADAELLVDLVDSDPQRLKNLAEEFNATVHPSFILENPEITELDEYYTVDLPGKASEKDIADFIKALNDHQIIDWVESNEVVSLSPLESENQSIHTTTGLEGLVNDPEIGKQWGLQNLDIASLYQTLKLKSVKPTKTALIAILDTGVDGQHEDLKDVFQSTKSVYDKDVQGHGTHVAGIAAAVSNNHVGIASFDPTREFIKVTSIKVLSDRGMGTQEGIIKGMIEAADLGADVISMSLGGRSNQQKEEAYEKAVKYCNDKGAIVVVAAGNSNSNARFYAPAKVEGVIAVSAINHENARTSFSNWVTDVRYGLAAPGDEIYSTFPGNQYRSFRGTSMACPHVSSIVAIMKSLDPDLKTDDVFRILDSTGTDSKQVKETGKIINPAQAVRALLD